MKILQVTHLFSPDQLAGASLYTDLASYLSERGHDVRVTTTFSYYPQLTFKNEDRGILVRNEQYGRIPLRRVGMFLPKEHRGWRRLVPEITFLGALTLAGAPPDWEPDVIFVACPMLAQVSWQHVAYGGKNIPKLVVVQDTMAHAATELGIVKNPLLGKALHGFEYLSLNAGTLHCSISPSMVQRVRSILGSKHTCAFVPNWIHGSLAAMIERKRQLNGVVKRSTQGGLFYSGNFGVKQGLPQFLRMLDSHRSGWKMSIHGGGAEADALKESSLIHAEWLTVGELLDEGAYVDKLLNVGACVVTQMPGVGANFLPSKLLPALAAGAPVLAICELGSPLANEVIEGDFGEVIQPNDVAKLGRVLGTWSQKPQKLNQFSTNARLRAERYSRATICSIYEKLLTELFQKSKQKVV